MSEDPRIQGLRALINQFDQLDRSAYDKKTLEKVADMAGEIAGRILAEKAYSERPPFPETLERPCCIGKVCGNTKLYLDTTEYPDGTIYYSYLRKSNDEEYVHMMNEIEVTEWLAATG